MNAAFDDGENPVDREDSRIHMAAVSILWSWTQPNYAGLNMEWTATAVHSMFLVDSTRPDV